MFIIEDEIHAEFQGKYITLIEAIAELQPRATLPWNELPNVAPCKSWETCGRKYSIVEYDISTKPWKELSRLLALEVSSSEAKWLTNVLNNPTSK